MLPSYHVQHCTVPWPNYMYMYAGGCGQDPVFLSLPLLLHGLPGREGEAVGLADGGAGEGVAGTPRWDLGHGANKVRNPFPPLPIVF